MSETLKIDLKLDPDEINQQLVKVILETSVGLAIKKGIEKQIKDLVSSNWNNPISDAIQQVIAEVVREEVLTKKEEIRAIIAHALTEDQIKKAVALLDKVLASR